MKIDTSLPVQYQQGSLPAGREGYENRSVDSGNRQEARNVLVPVSPRLPDDIVDINGWSSKKTDGGLAQDNAGKDSEAAKSRTARDEREAAVPASSGALSVYGLQQYRAQAGVQAGASLTKAGDVAYPKGSMIDVWA
jgi:hypothetical protein